MTHKFKIGDEVKDVATYIVAECYGSDDSPSYLLEINGRCSHIVLEEDLELITKPKETEMEKPKFKIGDRVSVSKGSWTVGKAEVIECDYPFYLVKYDALGFDCHFVKWVKEDRLKLVDDKPAEPAEPEKPAKPKVTFIGVFGSNLEFDKCSRVWRHASNVGDGWHRMQNINDINMFMWANEDEIVFADKLEKPVDVESGSVPGMDGVRVLYTGVELERVSEKPKFKIGDRVVAKEDANCFDEFKRIGFNIIGFEEDLALLKPIESFVPKHPEFCKVGRIACKIELLELYSDPEKPKVTFIGVANYDSYIFHVSESSMKPLFRTDANDKLFRLWFDMSLADITAESLFILSKLGYDIEIIGDGKEEFEKLCKEMEGG